jgi:hypothetical protein
MMIRSIRAVLVLVDRHASEGRRAKKSAEAQGLDFDQGMVSISHLNVCGLRVASGE